MLSIVALRFTEVVLSLTIRCSFKRWTHSPKEIVNMPWRKAAHHVLPVMRMPTAEGGFFGREPSLNLRKLASGCSLKTAGIYMSGNVQFT